MLPQMERRLRRLTVRINSQSDDSEKFRDSVYYDTISVSDFKVSQLKEMFAKQEVKILPKVPKKSLLHQLDVKHKISYVMLCQNLAATQMVLCFKVAACRTCKEPFTYESSKEILQFYKTHECQQQSGVEEN